MKNILRFSMFALASLFMVACDEDYKDWANPISYPEGEPVVVPTVTVNATSSETIDLETAESTIQLLTVDTESLGGATLKNIRFVPTDATGAELTDAAVTGIDGTGKFSKEALIEMIKNVYGKKRVEREFTGNVYANIAVAGSSEYTLAKLNTVTIKLTAPDPGYENFYLVGTPNSWDVRTKGTYMIPKEKGVYTFTTSYSGAWDFKFISEDDQATEGDAVWKYCWGNPSADNDKKADEGTLFYGAGEAEAGCITPLEAGYYTFTADMNTSTYTFTKLADQAPTEYTSMGVIGAFNSWGSDEAMTQAAPHFWYAEITLDAESELKFRANGGWDVNWGTKLTISEDVFYGVATNGGDNITVPAGKYAFYLNDITGEFAIVAK